ncbi:MAG: T9SS type A sorting domain-containing protein [Chitinophagales bacterium]
MNALQNIRVLLIAIELMAAVAPCKAQYDRKWSVGQFNVVLDFKNGVGNPIVPTNYHLYLYSTANTACIYDSLSGKLLYTNGNDIVTDHFDTIPGAYPMPDSLFANYWHGGYTGHQSSLLLPKDSNEYYHVTVSCSDDSFHQDSSPLNRTYYGVISRQQDGSFRVIRKRQIILKDGNVATQMTATQHANGRDWWIIQKAFCGNTYYIFLATPDTIHLFNTQVFGDSTGYYSDAICMSKFSAQGDKYIFTSFNHAPEVLTFDRCEGRFTDMQIVHCPFIQPNGDTLKDSHGNLLYRLRGAAFSPSGQFIYFNNSYSIVQYDLWAPNPDSTGVAVMRYDSATYNGEPYPLGYPFLAPNKEIYYDTYGILYAIHSIREPDKKGLACNYQPMYLPIPDKTSPLPNAVWFKSGKLAGACDTITGIQEADLSDGISIYPNPAHDHFRILSNEPGRTFSYSICEIAGLEVMSDWTSGENIIPINLRPGVYILNVRSNGKVAAFKLFVN